jgi:hypothetical protein
MIQTEHQGCSHARISLDIPKRDAECIDLHFRTGGDHFAKPDVLIVGFGCLAPTALRKIVRAIGD